MNDQKQLDSLEKEFADSEKEIDNELMFLDSFKKGTKPLKTLFSIFKGNYGNIVKSSIYFFLKYLPCVVQPIFTAALIDLAVNAISSGNAPDWTRVALYSIGTTLLYILNIPLNYVHTKYYCKAVRSVESGLRTTMVRKLQHLTISFHKEMQSGRIQSKIMRDVEAVGNLACYLFTNALAIAISLGSSLIVTGSKNMVVFASFFVLVPIAVVISRVFRGRIKNGNESFRKENESTYASVIEMVDLIPVTKAHALEEEATEKVNTRFREVAKKGYALDVLLSYFGSINWVSMNLFRLISLVFTVVLAFKKLISVGDITLYQSYFSTIVGDVTAVINLIPVFAKGFESIKSIGDIMSAYEIEDNEGKEKMPDLRGEYDFSDIVFDFKTETGTNRVLNGLNLHVNPGETIALVGESGSGKTTILNLVIGFYMAKEGSVKIDGKDIKDIDLHSYRQHIAMVPQNSILFSGTIRENITFGDLVPEDRLDMAVKAANLEEMLNNLPDGLDTQVGEHGDKLSGGQKQRISIARALIRDPEVIIFDEATSALDTVSERLIQEAIENLCKNRTTFIVAHRLSTIRNADKIAVISEGHCVEYGTYEELMEKKGEFYKFRSLQV